MPITSEEIQHITGITNYSIHSDIRICDYINNYIRNHRVTYPKWQRDDCWDDEYRTTLIESIVLKSDLPKLYLSKITETTYNILDGGHRTRTIKRYMDNEYPITIDDGKVYYDNAPVHNTRNNRIMNNDEKNIFDNYLLTITIYENLSEKESRKKFNQLQNSQPMTMADIVNSHESPLVDYLRSLETFSIDGQHLPIYFNDYKKVLVKSKNSHMLYQLASWFSICFPAMVGDKSDNALNNVLKSEKKEEKSTVYKYIIAHDEDIDQEQQDFFEECLTQLIRQIFTFKGNSKYLSIAEWASVLHANIYIENFNIDKFIEFHGRMIQYCKYLQESKNSAKSDNFAEAQDFKSQASNLNSQYNTKLSEWKKLKSNSNKNGMKVRYDIILRYCIDVNDDTEQVDHVDDFQSLPVMS